VIATTTEQRLNQVFVQLAAGVERMRRKSPTGGRRTKRRAEIGIMRLLYEDVLVVLERILLHQVELEAFQHWFRAGGPGMDAAAAAWQQRQYTTTRQTRVDIFTLYQWAYAIENTVRAFGTPIDLSELERLSIFRSKLVVHPAETALHRALDTPMAGLLWGPSPDQIRILSHPFTGKGLLRGHRAQLRRLEAAIPGLKSEPNQFEKIDLVYRYYCLISDRKLKGWARNTLFDRTGLRSDPPYVVAQALLDVLVAFRRLRHT
jgi:hypothetical protein